MGLATESRLRQGSVTVKAIEACGDVVEGSLGARVLLAGDVFFPPRIAVVMAMTYRDVSDHGLPYRAVLMGVVSIIGSCGKLGKCHRVSYGNLGRRASVCPIASLASILERRRRRVDTHFLRRYIATRY